MNAAYLALIAATAPSTGAAKQPDSTIALAGGARRIEAVVEVGESPAEAEPSRHAVFISEGKQRTFATVFQTHPIW